MSAPIQTKLKATVRDDFAVVVTEGDRAGEVLKATGKISTQLVKGHVYDVSVEGSTIVAVDKNPHREAQNQAALLEKDLRAKIAAALDSVEASHITWGGAALKHTTDKAEILRELNNPSRVFRSTEPDGRFFLVLADTTRSKWTLGGEFQGTRPDGTPIVHVFHVGPGG
jgi:hypothetical protein